MHTEVFLNGQYGPSLTNEKYRLTTTKCELEFCKQTFQKGTGIRVQKRSHKFKSVKNL